MSIALAIAFWVDEELRSKSWYNSRPAGLLKIRTLIGVSAVHCVCPSDAIIIIVVGVIIWSWLDLCLYTLPEMEESLRAFSDAPINQSLASVNSETT